VALLGDRLNHVGMFVASVIYHAYTSFPSHILLIRHPIPDARQHDQLFGLARTKLPLMRHLVKLKLPIQALDMELKTTEAYTAWINVSEGDLREVEQLMLREGQEKKA
jgi:hypothetical protein